ncbi:D-2-hydroxyacid dehydrogenase [Reyranella sp.]|jgi:phosphoglycerate dehydrogenase-like enzyme|uniref:D-2-hydroxyacid dehydrogenase n=1 Tax=Reyranella sp. TaxID=1929291 RepID=UPI000BD8C6EF|nr:D-2-hydroxyacid dehydrogenase [Reyranella sp.]OYY46878.1 MAG: hydroxyacid dehydrogenase [Rhodospirillales bacterium 35-66-84]OYZ96898.1 MAG: hydroxyacid dehydrogenase [Rhodospirillales bacterium 24-66-33]OZB27773.1 MAG: hydroxyacid dehydrogenase [Rhodospirillales bacterium 39-66-50]HQS13795.1 D-2-hydroxyacid dehydrogenase [Reyranella sp.]HQT10280.1 D-2-hydroxyacid dehydrogenase [Reyranella sp.]
MFPTRDKLTICFAHAAYQMKARFDARNTGINSFQVRSYDEFVQRVGEADVVSVSGMWKNDIIPHATKLQFVQSISSGMDQYSRELLGAKGIRLASAAGVNARAVAEHALALILAVFRRLPEARDNQHKKVWRGMLGDLTQREDELGGKTLLIVGMGRIGSHLAKLAKAFDMKVIGIRRDPTAGANGADEIHGMGDLVKLVPQADIVALTCALTPETTGLMSAAAFAAMKPSSVFVNVARGKVADEAALIATMEGNKIWAAALDVTAEEPLPAASPLWTMPNVFVTPHTAGETRAYEDNVIDILIENLDRLWRGEATLRNQVL